MPRTNWNTTARQFQEELLKSAKGFNRRGEKIMTEATQSFLDFVDRNQDSIPVYTGNLHDSIAAYVSKSGRVIRACYMPQEATKPQHVTKLTATKKRKDNGDTRYKEIWGYREAIKAVRNSKPLSKGIGSTLIVAVPYAGAADEKSSKPGYLDWLRETFNKTLESRLPALGLSNNEKV